MAAPSRPSSRTRWAIGATNVGHSLVPLFLGGYGAWFSAYAMALSLHWHPWLPSQLLPHTPEPTSWVRQLGVCLLLAILFFLPFLLIGLGGCSLLIEGLLLAFLGRRIHGRITDLWMKEDDGMAGRSFFVAFDFQPPGQSPFHQVEVNARVYTRCRPGDLVWLFYVPFLPSICRLT